MRSLNASLFLRGVFGVVCSVASIFGAEVKEIVSEAVFLGGEKREWAVFEGREAKGMELRVKFEGEANAAEQMLFVRQEDVKEEWGVSLNGQKIGNLFLMEADLVHALTVPAGALRDGENELLIAGSKGDDVVIHSVALVEDALPSMRALRISVAEAGGAGAGGSGGA
ncbi:MAG TPA: hypothetical protein VF773_21330, partial [Verrucomicrobiae bacterium]